MEIVIAIIVFFTLIGIGIYKAFTRGQDSEERRQARAHEIGLLDKQLDLEKARAIPTPIPCDHIWSKHLEHGQLTRSSTTGNTKNMGWYYIKECEKCKSINVFQEYIK